MGGSVAEIDANTLGISENKREYTGFFSIDLDAQRKKELCKGGLL